MVRLLELRMFICYICCSPCSRDESAAPSAAHLAQGMSQLHHDARLCFISVQCIDCISRGHVWCSYHPRGLKLEDSSFSMRTHSQRRHKQVLSRPWCKLLFSSKSSRSLGQYSAWIEVREAACRSKRYCLPFARAAFVSCSRDRSAREAFARAMM